MEPLSSLLYLLEPASLALLGTAVLVVLAAAHRALVHEKESERSKDLLESSLTLSGRQALLVPVASSLSLLLLFYLFTSVSQLITAFTALAAASSLTFSLSPVVAHLAASLGALDPPGLLLSPRGCGGVSRPQGLLLSLSTVLVVMWLLSGHWILNNILGMAICIAFVSHVKLPNVRVCTLLLSCLFFYDIFWVFFSERVFGANVMVAVATQQAQNPVHTVAQQLHLQLPEAVTKKLDLPVKLLFPRDLLRAAPNGTAEDSSPSSGMDFMMLGLGDMAIPGMLLALVLCFEHRKCRGYHDCSSSSGFLLSGGRQHKYLGYATVGYALGLVAALGAGLLTRAPQPALLYLVPSTLSPVLVTAWANRELGELWGGGTRKLADKDRERFQDVC